jgi:hypothetical protein
VGADLRNLANEAALLAARRNEESIHQKDVRAQALAEEGIRVSRANGLSAMEYYHLMALGLMALEASDHVRASALGAECLALARQIGHTRGATNALYILGRAAVGRGHTASFVAFSQET